MNGLSDELLLADWRRRVAELYAEVRRLAVTDPRAAHEWWRSERERLYREHPQSPVPHLGRDSFRARHFPYDPGLRFELPVDPEGSVRNGSAPLVLPKGGAEALAFRRVGTILVPFPDGVSRLSLFWMAGYAGGLFLPFRDATNGRETYDAGRYLLDGAKSADLGGDPLRGTLVLDFNFAYQPSCAFDPRWACPLAPPENRLDIEVRGGERLS